MDFENKQAQSKTCFAIGSLFFIQGIIFSSIASRVPDFKCIFGINDAALGMLLFALPLGQIVAMLLSGYLIGRYGSKKVLKFYIILYPAVFIVIPFVQQYSLLFFVFFLSGMGSNTINIAMNTQAIRAEAIYKRSLMPRFHGLWSLASVIGGVIGIIFVSLNFSMLSHYILSLVIYLSLGVYTAKFLFDTDKDKQEEGENIQASPLSFFVIFCGIVGFSCMFCEGIMYNWSSLYFKDIVGAPDNLINVGYVACMGAMVIGRFSAGYFIERFGQARIMLLCGLSISAGLAISVGFPYFISASIGMLFLGFGTSAVVPMVYSFAGLANPQDPSKVITAVATIAFLGFLCGSPLIGTLSYYFSLRVAFIPMIFIGLFIAAASYYFKKVRA